jgi:hypothetical protein
MPGHDRVPADELLSRRSHRHRVHGDELIDARDELFNPYLQNYETVRGTTSLTSLVQGALGLSG